MDYALLRQEGMKHIRDLAASIWTDHNTHDPGITLLEALCYAITDLGYRCDFSVEDILASDPDNRCGNTTQFYSAGEILPNHPFTINDFRKILIDLPDLRNAWLEKSGKSELPVYYNNSNNELTYTPTPSKLAIKGLYKVAVEFSEDSTLGDLNSNLLVVPVEFEVGTTPVTSEAEILFPGWDTIKPHWKKSLQITKITPLVEHTKKSPFHFSASVSVKIKSITTHDHFSLYIRIRNVDPAWLSPASTLSTALGNLIKKTGSGGLFDLFNQKLIRIGTILKNCRSFLDQHRNLCEDFQEVTPLKIQEITVDAEIELPLDAGVEDLLAELFFQIHCFLDPPIRFYTLAELLKEGISPENIFEGPLLKNGFIKDENLIAFKNRNAIYTSDLVNLIMIREGVPVVAIKGLKLGNYIDDTLISSDAKNCLYLSQPDIYKPKLSVEKSSVVCKKKGINVAYSSSKVLEKYETLVRNSEPVKTGSSLNQLTIPVGRDRHLGKYTSIQEHFPTTYGIGETGLPESAGAERKAKANQLKGYLLFFDQLFVQFLNQLSNVKNLFSIDKAVSKTYFEKVVYDVPGSMMLIREFIKSQPSMDDQVALDAAWTLFKADISNPYATGLKTLTEDDLLFRSRRNRFLDHLLARFCEDFTDYSLLLLANNHQLVPQELIDQKITLLNEYPVLGSERGKAFDKSSEDPLNPDVWDTSNITGLEKRGTRLLGFDDYNRRFLIKGDYSYAEFYQEIDEDGINEYRFRIMDEAGKIILSSTKQFLEMEKAYRVILLVLEYGKGSGNYKVNPSTDGKFYFNLFDNTGDDLARRVELFDTKPAAQSEINRVSGFLSNHFPGVADEPEEGFHVLEHILLRPKTQKKIKGKMVSDPLLPTIPDDFGNPVDEGRDPYSLRITIVFPADLHKFNDPNFRELAERIIRLETPAHVMPQVVFLNNVQLSHFEYAFKPWLELYAVPDPEDPALLDELLIKRNESLKKLVAAMVFVPPPPVVI